MQSNTFSSLFIGQNLVYLKSVNSTNDFLKNLLHQNHFLPEGTLVIAENQTAGRGQMGNEWHTSEGKNLTFSVVIHPLFLNIQQQFLINKIVCIGIYNVLSKYIKDVEIKWPNDIYYQSQKLGGILIEPILHGQQLKHIIVGIGLNVNQEVFPEILSNANSIKNIIQQSIDLETLLGQVCVAIEVQYLKLKSGNIDEINRKYLSILLGINQWRRFEIGGQMFDAQILGVSNLGHLQLCFQNNEVKEYNFKEVAFLF